MPKTASDEAHRGRLGPAAIAALTLIAVALGVSSLRLRRQLAQSEESLTQAHSRIEELEGAAEAQRLEAASAAERNLAAREEVEAAMARAAQAAREASTADQTAENLRRKAVGAEERTELALTEMRDAIRRADAAEAELRTASDRLDVLLERVEQAEAEAREAKIQLDLMRQTADRSGADASVVRAELDRSRAAYRSGLVEARDALTDALRRHEQATAVARQAEAAVEHAFRDFYDPSDVGRRPLEEYRGMSRRAERNADAARQRLQQATEKIEALLGAI